MILLGTIWTFNMFPVIFFVTGGEPAGQTEILVTGAFRAAFEGTPQLLASPRRTAC